MFRGRFAHTIDSKGRLSVPSRFREILKEKYDERLVVTTYDNCLLAYPYPEWRILEEKIEKLPAFKRKTRLFLRSFYSSGVDCNIDRLGRILIPQNLRDYAKLEKDVILVGAFKQVEIWGKERWDIAEAMFSPEEIGGMLENLEI